MKKILFVILLVSSHLIAQNIDSLTQRILSDSLFSSFNDSLLISDSLSIPDSLNIADSLQQKSSDDIDAIVFANAKDSLMFDVKNKEVYLYGEGNIKYKKTELKSGNIKVNFETSELEAIGKKDTTDSLNVKYVETPVLVEASDTYEGSTIKYNFKTQQGFITLAKNSSETKTYTGEKVKKVDKKTFFIEDGKFTTCDADTPHYYFGADRMKIIQGEQIIAKWIFMYIGGVPIPIPLPWGVFPNKTGRASGIIAPSYGYTETQGWYLRNMGYFYVINDYADVTANADYYFKGGYGFRGRMRYIKRYDFNGNVNGGFSNKIENEFGDPDYSERFDWNLNVNHNQKITPTMQLDVRLKFMSSDYIKYNSPNINDLVKQDIISNATFSKRWDGSGTNLTINYNRNQNLESGDITEDLPNITFSKSRAYPFQSTSGNSKDKSWYEYIGYDYSGKFKNNRKKKSGESTIHGGLDHSVNVSASPKLGYLSLSPSLRLNSHWYNKRQVQEFDSTRGFDGEDSLYLNAYDINELNTVNTYQVSLSASTKLYGVAQPQMLGVAAFRHTFEPRLSYNYHPDFSKDQWGYFDTYVDSTGRIIKYDKFGNQIFSGSGSGESQSLSLSLGNIFEIKTIKDPTDTTSESQKIKLLNLGISTSYNFVADSMRLAPISVSFNTQIGKMLTLQGSSVFSPYEYYNGNAVNQLLIDNGSVPLIMRSFNINLSSSLSEDIFKSQEELDKEEEEEDDGILGSDQQSDDYIELYKDDVPDFTIPWNLRLTYNYNYTNGGVGHKTERSNLGADLNFNLTKKWKFTFRGSYDVTNKKINSPQVTIYRDLHAWEANLAWTPIGAYKGFKFEIRLKAPEFRDLKLSKSKQIYEGF
jgi:LptD protein